MEKMNPPLKATKPTNVGGDPKPVPGGTAPGNPTKAHPGTGAKKEKAWQGYGKKP